MQAITPKEFLKLGHKKWLEVHWTIQPTPEMLNGFTAYPVGFPNKNGKIVPFALWLVK